MSTSNMVAENKLEMDKHGGPPPIDTSDVVTWAKKLKVYLMRKKRNHLGLEPHGLVMPGAGANAETRNIYRAALEAWKERKDTCVSAIYESVEENPDALEIVDQCFWKRKLSQPTIQTKNYLRVTY